MTQDSDNPEYWTENQSTESLFVHRIFTYMDVNKGQIYRTYAEKNLVSFDNQEPWYFYIPVLDWFVPDIDKKGKEYDIMSYSFETMPYASSSIELVVKDPAFGYVQISIT